MAEMRAAGSYVSIRCACTWAHADDEGVRTERRKGRRNKGTKEEGTKEAREEERGKKQEWKEEQEQTHLEQVCASGTFERAGFLDKFLRGPLWKQGRVVG